MKRVLFMSMISAVFAAGTLSAQFVPRNGGYGPRDGSGYNGAGPKDGTGYGAKSGKGKGGGICDQTGPKGPRNGQGQGKGQGKGRGGRG
jgi:hypothetical protein